MVTKARYGLIALSLLLLLLAAVTFGCAPDDDGEVESAVLTDLDPPAGPDDESLAQSDGPQPIPGEPGGLRADPDDPRASAALADLDDRQPEAGADADEPRPIPDEPPAGEAPY